MLEQYISISHSPIRYDYLYEIEKKINKYGGSAIFLNRGENGNDLVAIQENDIFLQFNTCTETMSNIRTIKISAETNSPWKLHVGMKIEQLCHGYNLIFPLLMNAMNDGLITCFKILSPFTYLQFCQQNLQMNALDNTVIRFLKKAQITIYLPHYFKEYMPQYRYLTQQIKNMLSMSSIAPPPAINDQLKRKEQGGFPNEAWLNPYVNYRCDKDKNQKYVAIYEAASYHLVEKNPGESANHYARRIQQADPFLCLPPSLNKPTQFSALKFRKPGATAGYSKDDLRPSVRRPLPLT